jgi:hypothetical protein
VADAAFLVTRQSLRAPSDAHHIHFEGRADGAAPEIHTGGLIGEIALSSAIDQAGPTAENGMIHPVEATDEPNSRNESDARGRDVWWRRERRDCGSSARTGKILLSEDPTFD